MFLSEICWRSGVPFEGEQEGEGRSFRDRKGQAFPACEPRKGHFGGTERRDIGLSPYKIRKIHEIHPKMPMGLVSNDLKRPLDEIGREESKG